MTEYITLGDLDPSLLEKEFGELETSEVIVTFERIEHILSHHILDIDLFERFAANIIADPDLILKDAKNAATVFYIKQLHESHMNLIIRVSLKSDFSKRKNSVMTFYRLRQKNLDKLKNHCKTLYKRE